MQEEEWNALSTEERLYFYRCPACGKMVDKRSVEQIVEHHSHVLHPERIRGAGSLSPPESARSKEGMRSPIENSTWRTRVGK